MKSRYAAAPEPALRLAAAAANERLHDAIEGEDYLDGAPHLKHAEVRALFLRLLEESVREARSLSSAPCALDIGAGGGAATLPLLAAGVRVVAVDVSSQQLRRLEEAAGGGELETLTEEAFSALDRLRAAGRRFEIVVANSLLHHVPDYLALLRAATGVLVPGGCLLTFQDPMRYGSLGLGERLYSGAAYGAWRLRRPDALGGIARTLRRRCGIYALDCPHDNVEYHVVRDGVDQQAALRELRGLGLACRLVEYFSTPGPLWQSLGTRLGLRNTFAVVARMPLP